MQKSNNREPIPTTKPQQTVVPEPPPDITHVYARQHKAQGLEAPYNGPFPVVSRPSRSTVQIQVGLSAKGEPRYETRSWRDLKVASKDPEAKDAERPRKGRPKKKSSSKPDSKEGVNTTLPVNNAPNSNEEPSINSPPIGDSSVEHNREVRSTRNPNPKYIEGVVSTGPPLLTPFAPIMQKAWSASPMDLDILNRQIG